jgi:hypothetical protein
MTTPEAFLFVGTLLVVMLHTNPLVLYFVASAGWLAWFQISCENKNPNSAELEHNKRMLANLPNGSSENCTKEARGTTIVRALASRLAWVSDQLRKHKP